MLLATALSGLAAGLAANVSSSQVPSANLTLPVGASWQIVLRSIITTPTTAAAIIPQSAIVWDVDLLDSSTGLISALKAANKTVICYFNAGGSETWRSDYTQFLAADIGKKLDKWEGENWIDTRSVNVRNIMRARIALARTKGCDAVDPDNMDGYATSSGFPLTQATAIDYMQFLSAQAKANGLLVGLKNAGQIVPQVLNITDFAVNEQCVQYAECAQWTPYIAAGKPVFHIEYPSSAPVVTQAAITKACSRTGDSAGSEGFSTILATYDLNGQVTYCDGRRYITPVSAGSYPGS